MKFPVFAPLIIFLLVSVQLRAQKPFDQWQREDILSYFDENEIHFEGSFRNEPDQLDIMIGQGKSENSVIHYNFYLKNGFLERTLITVSQQHAFQLINHQAEKIGFSKLSESADQLGNLYCRYSNKEIELLVINKTADWPEMYFHP